MDEGHMQESRLLLCLLFPTPCVFLSPSRARETGSRDNKAVHRILYLELKECATRPASCGDLDNSRL